MRVNELVKSKQILTEESLKSYFERLISKHKIQKLGGGAFSKVFQHPLYGNVVVKVYTNKDAVYKKYVKWCLKNQHNPYVPRIIEQVKYTSPETGDKYNIIFLEKMQPISSGVKLISLLIKALGLDRRSVNDSRIIYFMGRNAFTAKPVIDRCVKDGRGDKYFRQIWEHIRSYGADKFDLHHGNAMLRDGQLVLTDPVANRPSTRVDEL
jgi:hypothetical protein